MKFDITPDARFPMIVPPNHPVTQLLIASVIAPETRPCKSKSHSRSPEGEGLDFKREVLSSQDGTDDGGLTNIPHNSL